MKTKDSTILITGGATGIGFALAEILVKSGNKVIICSRREEKLKEASTKLPQLVTKVCDVSKQNDRESLYEWIKDQYPALNILINNAGVQRTIDFKEGIQAIIAGDNEIETNFTAPIYLFLVVLYKKGFEKSKFDGVFGFEKSNFFNFKNSRYLSYILLLVVFMQMAISISNYQFHLFLEKGTSSIFLR